MSVTAESATQEAVRGTLSVDDTLDEVKKLLEQYAWANHPMWKSLIEGTVNIEQLREWVRQYGVFALHNHGYHGPLYVNCPDPKMRAMLAEVVYEEGTGLLYSNGKPHNEIWCQFGEAIGLTREEMWGAELCSGARALKAFLNDRCNNSFIEGVSALMLAGEAQVPGFSTSSPRASRRPSTSPTRTSSSSPSTTSPTRTTRAPGGKFLSSSHPASRTAGWCSKRSGPISASRMRCRPRFMNA